MQFSLEDIFNIILYILKSCCISLVLSFALFSNVETQKTMINQKSLLIVSACFFHIFLILLQIDRPAIAGTFRFLFFRFPCVLSLQSTDRLSRDTAVKHRQTVMRTGLNKEVQ